MPTPEPPVERLLTEDFFARHPEEAADQLELSTPAEAAEVLAQLSPRIASAAFRRVAPAKAVDILAELGRVQAIALLRDLDPPQAGALLSSLDEQQRQELLAGVAPAEARQLRSLMDYPADSAGRLMDPRIAVFRPGMTAEAALERLRSLRHGRRFSVAFSAWPRKDAAGFHSTPTRRPGDCPYRESGSWRPSTTSTSRAT